MRTRFVDHVTLDFAPVAVAPAVAKQEGARLIVRDAVVARSGLLTYHRRDGSRLVVLRRAEDMRAPEVLKTYELLPLTNTHPDPSDTAPQRVKRVQIGATGSVARAEDAGDGEVVARVDVAIHAAEGQDAARAGRRQFSHGYYAQLTPAEPGATWRGEAYDMIQVPLEGDHMALVDLARAGAVTEFHLDAADLDDILVQDQEQPKPEEPMKVRIKDGQTQYEIHQDDEPIVTRIIAERDKAQGEASALPALQAARDAALVERDKERARAEEALGRLAALEAEEGKRRLAALRDDASRFVDAKKVEALGEVEIKRLVLRELGATLADDASQVAVDAAYSVATSMVKPARALPIRPAADGATPAPPGAAPVSDGAEKRRNPGAAIGARLVAQRSK